MRIPTLLLLTATLTLSACQSRWNPANWWGRDRESAVQTDVNPLIPDQTEDGRSFFSSQEQNAYVGQPIQQVIKAESHRVPEGQMILAVGVAAVHGVNNIRLIAANGGAVEGGVLTLNLMGIVPEEPVVGGSDVTREVTAAVVLTDQQLAGARVVRIRAAANSQDTRVR
ncbi:hypothetical protein NBRC116594_02750 [Shimia sp. NS0008-38b]|uniref:hypothetical protein n=1 Tax=Shimia sp. NS0008-38b TaxID=3127653 RepID=UPI003108919F